MKSQTAKLYTWALEKATSDKAPWWIGMLFSLELLLFIPLDAVLLFFCLQTPRRAFLYAGIAAVASVFSATAGYMLGHLLWDVVGPHIVPALISSGAFDRMTHHLEHYEQWAVFLGSLLPFPIKVLSLAAGVFHLPFVPFVVSVFSARLLRFMLVAGAAVLGGEKVKQFVDRHFHRIVLLVGAKVVAVFLFVWVLAR